jgi:molybdopterin-biosynthesis enzyme MoeA-like protein
MARIPQGADLIENSVSKAPGFSLGNVHVMAGVPAIMQAMLDALAPRLATGKKMLSRSVPAKAKEGDVATPLAEVQKRFPTSSWELSIADGIPTTTLVFAR